MTPELKVEIDKSVTDSEARFTELKIGNIDCWVILRIKSNKIEGEPIAIFSTKERLYEKFEECAASVDPSYGIIIAAWKFD